MIGLDTNILLRFLSDDDIDQRDRARAFLAENCTAGRPGYVNLVVLAELVWVLDRSYNYPTAAVARTVLQLIEAEELIVQQADVVRQACLSYLARPAEAAQVGLADQILHALNRAAGCAATATMDRRFAREPGVQLI